MQYRPNDCAYIYNPKTKPVTLMYDKVEYVIKPKQIVPFPGVLCDWFVSQFPMVQKLEVTDVETKKSKTAPEQSEAQEAPEASTDEE